MSSRNCQRLVCKMRGGVTETQVRAKLYESLDDVEIRNIIGDKVLVEFSPEDGRDYRTELKQTGLFKSVGPR